MPRMKMITRVIIIIIIMLSPTPYHRIDNTESTSILDNFLIFSYYSHYPQNNVFINEYSFLSIVSKS